MENPTCEVCNKAESIGVCCVPGVPYSAAYCRGCLEANAHPWFALVANTACCDGFDKTNTEWQEMVKATCTHLGRTLDQFGQEVATAIVEMNKYNEEVARTHPLVSAMFDDDFDSEEPK